MQVVDGAWISRVVVVHAFDASGTGALSGPLFMLKSCSINCIDGKKSNFRKIRERGLR